MGQLVGVTALPSSRPDILRFETNRTFTGMAHERYSSKEDAERRGSRPPDVLAARLLGLTGVRGVHVHSNIVTIELEPGTGPPADEVAEVIRELYRHYRPGVTPSIPA